LSLYLSGSLIVLFFFFSSRRRHTRSKRDWSSDVCSSDLFPGQGRSLFHQVPPRPLYGIGSCLVQGIAGREVGVEFRVRKVAHRRSEERRVGKEWSSRWPPQHRQQRDTEQKGTTHCTNTQQ